MNIKTQYSSILEQSTNYTLLFILSVIVFFVGATEFMLSSMLTPLAIAFGTNAIAAFGVGLGLGNLSAGWLRKLCCREEVTLATIGLVAGGSSAAMVMLSVGLVIGLTLTILDFWLTRSRNSAGCSV